MPLYKIPVSETMEYIAQIEAPNAEEAIKILEHNANKDSFESLYIQDKNSLLFNGRSYEIDKSDVKEDK